MLERTLLKIEPEGTPWRTWNDPSTDRMMCFMICCDDALDYFDVPLVDVTLVLSTSYSEGDCYEFKAGEGGCYSEIVIEGKPENIALYSGLEKKIGSFIKKHGRCYLSLEFDA